MTASEHPQETAADEPASEGDAAAASARLPAPEPIPAPRRIPSAPADPLRVLPWIAAVGVTALVLGRFVAPSLPGTIVGAARAVRIFEVAGNALSQLFAALSIVGLGIALLGLANSTVSAFMRLLAVLVSAWVTLMVVFGAITADRLAEMPTLVGAFFAGTFAILAALSSRGAPVARVPALVLGLVGAASILRSLHGLASVAAASVVPAPSLLSAGRGIGTVAAVFVGIAVLLALVQTGRGARSEDPPGEPAQRSLWSPLAIVVLVLAIVCARQAMAGASSDAGIASVLLKRASDRFLVSPEPYLGRVPRLFLGFLTPLTAASLLFVRRMRTLAAALALALVAADITGAPLGAIALVLASLAVLLVARSGHVLWSALIARPPSPPTPPR